MYISIYGICILVTFKSIMDVEITLSKCNFGETMGDECNELSHTRRLRVCLVTIVQICKIYFL